jgi:hypothetical protein
LQPGRLRSRASAKIGDHFAILRNPRRAISIAHFHKDIALPEILLHPHKSTDPAKFPEFPLC